MQKEESKTASNYSLEQHTPSNLEKTFTLSGIDEVSFYGVNHSNLYFLRTLFPKLKIGTRGNEIKTIGQEEDIEQFSILFDKLLKHCEKFNFLSEESIANLVNMKKEKEPHTESLIIHGIGGKPIVSRTPNQCRLVESYAKNDLIFALGPSGSGKTYTAIALAMRSLKNREVRRIILTRPAVEAGEKLGFLPGDMKEKIDPYLQPIYDALEDMISIPKLKECIENKVIQIAPLAFMRGRTLSDAVILLDEAQNATIPQIKMFLTRMGVNSKMILTGDITQIDLPHSTSSGLIHAVNLLKDIKGVSVINFSKTDIIRHQLVKYIVEAYEHSEQKEYKTSFIGK
ncbi:MAG TPA: phosphate starvation-inducible protein PhoH [Porphyromonadaceae bacterium]|nr:phosphate starvation-inducible protein PhoH [Porphyromonadaceae bacterium]